MNIDWSVVLTAVQIALAIFVAVTTWRVTQRKNTIEYWQGVANSLEARIGKLEVRLTRTQAAMEFLCKHVKPEVAAVAREIESGILIRKPDEDITESHS